MTDNKTEWQPIKTAPKNGRLIEVKQIFTMVGGFCAICVDENQDLLEVNEEVNTWQLKFYVYKVVFYNPDELLFIDVADEFNQYEECELDSWRPFQEVIES